MFKVNVTGIGSGNGLVALDINNMDLFGFCFFIKSGVVDIDGKAAYLKDMAAELGMMFELFSCHLRNFDYLLVGLEVTHENVHFIDNKMKSFKENGEFFDFFIELKKFLINESVSVYDEKFGLFFSDKEKAQQCNAKNKVYLC